MTGLSRRRSRVRVPSLALRRCKASPGGVSGRSRAEHASLPASPPGLLFALSTVPQTAEQGKGRALAEPASAPHRSDLSHSVIKVARGGHASHGELRCSGRDDTARPLIAAIRLISSAGLCGGSVWPEALSALRAERPRLDSLAAALLEEETLDELDACRAAGLPPAHENAPPVGAALEAPVAGAAKVFWHIPPYRIRD
jgi:hypothetical protein